MNSPGASGTAWPDCIRRELLYGVTGLVFAGFLLVNLVGIQFVDGYAWDDGAITLAYARRQEVHRGETT
jgi:hypothetical protein